jgi:outer membrane protein TolC
MYKKIISFSLLGTLLILNGVFTASLRAEDKLPSIWDDFDTPSSKTSSTTQNGASPVQSQIKSNKQVVPFNSQRTTSRPPQNGYSSEVKISPDPFKLLEELNDPNAPPPQNDFLSGQDDPQGRDLQRALPLDIPLSDRQLDILDPIELDVDSPNVLSLSLEKALLISLQSNLPQRIIDETVIRDRWRFWNTGSSLLPDGFLGYNDVRRSGGSSFSSSTGTPINSGSNYIAQLGVRYTLGPAQVFSTLASYYDWMANTRFQGANLQDLMRQTANQYYDVMRARAELAVRIEAVKQAKIQLSLNQKLDEAGVGTRFAVLQATEQLAENELALQEQQSAARIAEIQLLTTMNVPLGTDIRLEESQITKKTLVSPDYQMGELIDYAFTNRPDIGRRQFAVKAARQRVNQAIAGYVPSLTASYSMNSFADRFGPSVDPRNIDTLKTASLGVDWPLLTGMGLTNLSNINVRRAESRQAGLELQNEKLQIEGQLRDAFLRSQSSQKQISTSQNQLDAATEGIKLARIRLQNGVGTNIDLIDTQRNYVNSLVNIVRAIAQYNQAQIDMLRAMGVISVHSILDQDFAFASAAVDDTVEEDQEDFQQADYSSGV